MKYKRLGQDLLEYPGVIQEVIRGSRSEIEHYLKHNSLMVNEQDYYGRTPIMHAALQCNLDMIKWLSKTKDIDVKIVDYEGNDLLFYAFWSGNDELVDFVFGLLHKPPRGAPAMVGTSIEGFGNG